MTKIYFALVGIVAAISAGDVNADGIELYRGLEAGQKPLFECTGGASGFAESNKPALEVCQKFEVIDPEKAGDVFAGRPVNSGETNGSSNLGDENYDTIGEYFKTQNLKFRVEVSGATFTMTDGDGWFAREDIVGNNVADLTGSIMGRRLSFSSVANHEENSGIYVSSVMANMSIPGSKLRSGMGLFYTRNDSDDSGYELEGRGLVVKFSHPFIGNIHGQLMYSVGSVEFDDLVGGSGLLDCNGGCKVGFNRIVLEFNRPVFAGLGVYLRLDATNTSSSIPQLAYDKKMISAGIAARF